MAAYPMEREYPVFREFGDLSRVDMLVEVGPGRFVRIQVKCFRSRNGAVRIRRWKSGPGYKFRYEAPDVDLFAVYVYDRDALFFIPSTVVCGNDQSITLRLDPSKNGQEARIRSADRYRCFEAAIRNMGFCPRSSAGRAIDF